MCLLVLAFTWNQVFLPAFDQSCTGLVVRKRDSAFHALLMQVENPGIVARPGLGSGFPADRYSFYQRPAIFQVFVKERSEIYSGQHRLHHHGIMREGEGQVNRKTPVCHCLVLTGDRYCHMMPSLIPVRRQMIFDPLRPFCNHEESTIGAFPHHVPHLRPPVICIFVEEVGRETSIDLGTGRYLIETLIFAGMEPPDREIEALRFSDDRRVIADGLIPTKHVAMQAARRMARASVDAIPCNSCRRPRICCRGRRKKTELFIHRSSLLSLHLLKGVMVLCQNNDIIIAYQAKAGKQAESLLQSVSRRGESDKAGNAQNRHEAIRRRYRMCSG